jgi:hypothetical protein
VGADCDSLIDTPTNYTAASGNNGGNYCTWNSLVGRYNDSGQSGTAPTFSNGNLNVSGGQTNDRIAGTFHFNVGQSGKYYWEVTFTGTPASSNGAGVRDYSAGTSTLVLKLWYYDGSTTDGGPATSFTTGDVLGFAMDLSAGTIDCYKNGGSSVGQMDISSLTSVTPFVQTNSGVEVVGNFGQRPFAYTPPTNHVSLCTQNLDDPAIADGSTAMDVITATGTAADRTFTMRGGFGPDLVWAKQRNATSNHALFDTVRGATKRLVSNSSQVEDTQANQLKAFTSTGFTYGSDIPNNSSQTGVYWCWDGGTSTESNTDGSITCNVRASASSGFSIVEYSGTGSNDTFGHGLSAAPALVIIKKVNGADNWHVYHEYAGNTGFLKLNDTTAFTTKATAWNNTSPTSSVVSLGTDGGVNSGVRDFIAYCFSPVNQYSSFGGYTGNGGSNGPFVFTEFRPAFLLLKRTDGAVNWLIYDNKREGYNFNNDPLYANLDASEGTTDYIDLLSNGFKIRNTHSSINASGGTYAYAAFAEHPFKTARAR